jgi:glyoxylase-like metal-dependent hydrolase (beta-lactamase superfamily II)
MKHVERITDGNLEIVAAGPAGYGNNIYIVIDRETGDAAFIDAPGEPDKSIAAAEEAGVSPSKILLTHAHFDHTDGIAALKERYGSELYAAPNELPEELGEPDEIVRDAQEIPVGNLGFRVIYNPGHTPGSISFLHGNHVFVGDTLFPGGPGRTRTNADLMQEIDSIKERLYTLPDDTIVWPGHGDRTTIGESKAEFAEFDGREHDPDLHGDVLWRES